jgi:hypothetical protein
MTPATAIRVVVMAAAALASCAAPPEFTRLGWNRYKVTVPLGRSRETARRNAEDAAARKCQESHDSAQLENYIDALSTPGRYSQYFECIYLGDLIE